MLGPFPSDAHAAEGAADGLGAERTAGYAPLEADLSQQPKRPETGRLAERARAFVHEGSKPLTLGIVEHRCGCLWARRSGSQASAGIGSIRTNGIADGLRGTSHVRRNLGGAFPASAGEENLAAPQLERVA